MVEPRTWKEFQEIGLLWWINRSLHLFGWAIVIEEVNGSINVYPARVQYRGFAPESEDRGFKRVTKYLSESSDELLIETEED